MIHSGKLMQTGHMPVDMERWVIGIRFAHVTKWMEPPTTENF